MCAHVTHLSTKNWRAPLWMLLLSRGNTWTFRKGRRRVVAEVLEKLRGGGVKWSRRITG